MKFSGELELEDFKRVKTTGSDYEYFTYVVGSDYCIDILLHYPTLSEHTIELYRLCGSRHELLRRKVCRRNTKVSLANSDIVTQANKFLNEIKELKK